MIAVLHDAQGNITHTVVGSQEIVELCAHLEGSGWTEYTGAYDPSVIDHLDQTHVVTNQQVVPKGA